MSDSGRTMRETCFECGGIHDGCDFRACIKRLKVKLDQSEQIISDLRRKLAIAGIEGSPPPGQDTMIGILTRRVHDAEVKLATALAKVDGVDYREGHFRDNLTPDECREVILGLAVRLEESDSLRDAMREGALVRMSDLETKLAESEAALHRFQHGEQVDGDYICQSTLEAQAEIDALKAKLAEAVEALRPLASIGCQCAEAFADHVDISYALSECSCNSYSVVLGDVRRAARLVTDYDAAQKKGGA